MGEDDRDDAPAALLTSAQREYLRGDKEYRPSVERDVKKRIRERIRITFGTDMPLLHEELTAGERRQIVDSFGPEHIGAFGGEELATGLQSTVALVYKLAREGGFDPETVIDAGIQAGKTNRVDLLEKRFNQGDDSLSVAELEELAEAGRIDRDERREWLRERFTDEPKAGFVDPDDPSGDPRLDPDEGGGDGSDQ